MVNPSIIKLVHELSNHIPIMRIRGLLKISRNMYYQKLKKLNEISVLSDIKSRIHQLCLETYFIYGYREIHALLTREIQCSVSKVQCIMQSMNRVVELKSKNLISPVIHIKFSRILLTKIGKLIVHQLNQLQILRIFSIWQRNALSFNYYGHI